MIQLACAIRVRDASRFVSAVVLGVTVLAAGVAQSAAEGVEEVVRNTLRLDGDAARGASIYREHCVSCHRVQAYGDPARDIPALAGQRRAYLVKQLADFKGLGRASADMHGVLSRPGIDQQAWADLAVYLNGLPPIEDPERGDGKHVQLGEAIFQERCSSCHAQDAAGTDDGFVPSLRNQHYTYLLNETRTIAHWHTRNLDEHLVRFLESLDEVEIKALADYLSRQHGSVRQAH